MPPKKTKQSSDTMAAPPNDLEELVDRNVQFHSPTEPTEATGHVDDPELGEDLSHNRALLLRRYQAARQRMQTRSQWKPNLPGQAVSSISELRNGQHYLVLSTTRDMILVMRKIAHRSSQLFIAEYEYSLSLHISPSISPVLLSNFSHAMVRALRTVYDGMLQQYQDQSVEIQMAIAHPDMTRNDPVQTTPIRLTERNRDLVILQLMDQLSAWNQSCKPEATVETLTIEVVIGAVDLSGQGRVPQLLAISDDQLRQKSVSRINWNGTVFYANTTKYCFFASVYFGIQFQQFEKACLGAKKGRKLKQLADAFYNMLALKTEVLEEKVKAFFARYSMDIEQYESGSIVAMKKLHQLFDIQISVYDDSVAYNRVLQWPSDYNPQLAQVYVLRTQYLLKTSSLQEKSMANHYHGLRTTARGLVGLGRQFCPHCGLYYDYNNHTHSCRGNGGADICKLCYRPRVHEEIWKCYSRQSKALFCVKEEVKAVTCRRCHSRSPDPLCGALHKNHCRRVVCGHCNRLIRTDVGKYKDEKVLEEYGGHQSCAEVFCYHCLDYFEYFGEVHTMPHTCFVKTINQCPPHPAGKTGAMKCWIPYDVNFFSGYGVFDLETTIDQQVNLVSLIYEDMNYEKNPEGEARMVTFSDIDYKFRSVKKPDGSHVMEPVPYEEQVLTDGQFGFKTGPWLPWEFLYTESCGRKKQDPAEEHRQREENICSRQEKSRAAFEKRMEQREAELKHQKEQQVIPFRYSSKLYLMFCLQEFLEGSERFPEMRGNLAHPMAQTLEALRQESALLAEHDTEELPFEPEANSPGMLALLMAQMEDDGLSHEAMVDRSVMAQRPVTEEEAQDSEAEFQQARPPKRKKLSRAAAEFIQMEAQCEREPKDETGSEEDCPSPASNCDFMAMDDIPPDCLDSPKTSGNTAQATQADITISPCRTAESSSTATDLCQHARFAFDGDPETRPYDYAGKPHREKSLTEFVRYICQERFRNYVFLAHYGNECASHFFSLRFMFTSTFR